jgi:hypothetical protein
MLNGISKILNMSLIHLRYDGRGGYGESVPRGVKGQGYCGCWQRMNMMRWRPDHAARGRYEGNPK